MGKLLLNIEERISSSTDVRGPDECWNWKKPRRDGYGSIMYMRKRWVASRLVYRLKVGDPGKLEVCHTCDNPSCVNPKHLYAGTHQQNMRDAADRLGLAEKIRKARSPLTANKVREIRKLHSCGSLSYASLGRKFGVHRETIRGIVTNYTWRNV